MLPHLFQKGRPVENKRWSYILAAMSLVATIDPVSLAEATECPITEDAGMIPGQATGKGAERNIYESYRPSSAPEIAPHTTGSRIACVIGKPQSKPYRKLMNVSALSYNGKRQILPIRTTPPEIRVPVREQSAALIGPVQEILKPSLPYERRTSQAVATLRSTVESTSLFGGQSVGTFDRFSSALQEPGNEYHRMNLTTAQALHGGNCPGGCP